MNTYNTKYGKVTLYSNETYIGNDFKQGKYWDEDTLLKLRPYINPNKSILEIGGHCGTSSIVYSSFLAEGSNVYVFEPQKNMFSLLMHNIRQNNLRNIIPYNAAIFCFQGECSMNDVDLDGGGGLVAKRYAEEQALNCNFGGIGLGKGGEQVETTTMDAIDIPDVGFIHCDAQGSENFIFSCGTNFLAKHRPVILYEDNQKYAQYLYNSVCNAYPQYKEASLFDVRRYCIEVLGYRTCIERFNGSIDALLIP